MITLGTDIVSHHFLSFIFFKLPFLVMQDYESLMYQREQLHFCQVRICLHIHNNIYIIIYNTQYLKDIDPHIFMHRNTYVYPYTNLCFAPSTHIYSEIWILCIFVPKEHVSVSLTHLCKSVEEKYLSLLITPMWHGAGLPCPSPSLAFSAIASESSRHIASLKLLSSHPCTGFCRLPSEPSA